MPIIIKIACKNVARNETIVRDSESFFFHRLQLFSLPPLVFGRRLKMLIKTSGRVNFDILFVFRVSEPQKGWPFFPVLLVMSVHAVVIKLMWISHVDSMTKCVRSRLGYSVDSTVHLQGFFSSSDSLHPDQEKTNRMWKSQALRAEDELQTEWAETSANLTSVQLTRWQHPKGQHYGFWWSWWSHV